MNIIINKHEYEILCPHIVEKITIGGHMYHTNNDQSDLDILCIYRMPINWEKAFLPNIHQFQYKDTNDNIDYIFTDEDQFWRNQQSGDSTINSDVVLFTGNYDKEQKLQLCRTYNVIKAYLGFAKRDIAQINKSKKDKLFHAQRGIYMAEKLLNNELPILEDIQYFKNNKDMNKKDLVLKCKELRSLLNEMYNNDAIGKYFIPKVEDSLYQKLLNSNNIKEFRYE